MPIRYVGHVLIDGSKSNMSDWVKTVDEPGFDIPVLMIVGTSMSAGKTYSGRVAVRLLKELGHKVVAAKLTGAGRRRDVVSMGDAGADHIFDFIDAGLPTTVCPPDQYRSHIGGLLERMNATDASVAVIEAGASPLEPYNGATVVELLGKRIGFTILCASDPYAVRGIQDAWGRAFDLIAGPTANTAGGVALVAKLADAPAFDVMDESVRPEFRDMLLNAFGEGPGR